MRVDFDKAPAYLGCLLLLFSMFGATWLSLGHGSFLLIPGILYGGEPLAGILVIAGAGACVALVAGTIYYSQRQGPPWLPLAMGGLGTATLVAPVLAIALSPEFGVTDLSWGPVVHAAATLIVIHFAIRFASPLVAQSQDEAIPEHVVATHSGPKLGQSVVIAPRRTKEQVAMRFTPAAGVQVLAEVPGPQPGDSRQRLPTLRESDLRFVASSCVVHEDRLLVQWPNAAREQEIPMDAVGQIRVRQLPKHLGSEVFLDLVMRREGDPVRILPRTYVNYSVLDGKAATISVDNYRRLTHHLRNHCPSIEVEDQSRPSLLKGASPPRLATPSELERYESTKFRS